MNFITFINETNKYSKCLYKIWKEFISFNMKEKREFNTSPKFCEGKTKFGKF